MADFFFFTEYDRLLTQSTNDAFGPDAGSSSTKFNFTSIHNNDPLSGTTNLKAFAVCDGQVLIQAIPDYANSLNESNYVNVILKPAHQGEYDFQNIKYFIFRNILKSSIIDADNLRIAPAITTDLTSTIWATQNSINASKDSAEGNPSGTTTSEPNRILTGINFTANISGSGTTPAGDIKADNQSFDDLFFNNQDNFAAPKVKAGETIGFFDPATSFGFDIIMDGYREPVQFGSLRNTTNSITVSALPGSPSKIQIFTDKSEREKILSYFDPCTFFASFFNGVLFAKDSTGTQASFTSDNLYTSIISKFENKNKIYIDIRNENDLSYNYYDNYPDLKIAINTGASTTIQYTTLGWPLLMLDNAEFSGSSNDGSKNNITFNLPDGDNTDGLVYLANAYLSRKYPKKRKGSKKFIPLDYSGGFAQDIKLSIPNTSSSQVQVSSYIKLNYIKRNQSNTPVNTTVFQSDNFLQNLFYPFIPISFWSSSYNTKFALGSYQKFVDAKNDFNFSAVAETGYASEGGNVILYSVPKDIYEHTGHKFTSIAPVTSGNTDNTSFLLHTEKIIAGFKLIKQELTISGNTEYYLEFLTDDGTGKPKYKKENLFAVCMNATEFLAVQNVMSNFNTQIHPVFLTPFNIAELADDNGKFYLKVDWTIAGLDNNANFYTYPTALFTTKSGDRIIHASSDFATAQVAPVEQAKIAFYTITANNVHQYSKRLSIFQMPKTSWELYDLNGVQKTYGSGETDWDGSSLSGTNINLAVGTRVLKLGKVNITIGSETQFEFVVLWHKGAYRDGIVSTNSFKNSVDIRVNLQDATKSGDSVLREPFLNDCDQWINYLDSFFSYNIQNFESLRDGSTIPSVIAFYQAQIDEWNNSKFNVALTNVKLKFATSKSLSASVLNSKIRTLLNTLYTKDLLSLNTGNFASNTDNLFDTVERWQSNPTFQQFLSEKPPTITLEVPRITKKWVEEKLISPNGALLANYYLSNPVSPITISNLTVGILDQQSSGFTCTESEETILREGLAECKSILAYINLYDPLNPVLNDPNAQWISSFDENAPDLYIVICDAPFYEVEREGIYVQGIGVDSSFGYLNTDTAYSVFLHEYNVSTLFVGKSIFKHDTHIDPSASKENELKEFIEGNNYSSIEYFNEPIGSLKIYNPAKEYHYLFQFNPFVGLAYLDYFFNKM